MWAGLAQGAGSPTLAMHGPVCSLGVARVPSSRAGLLPPHLCQAQGTPAESQGAVQQPQQDPLLGDRQGPGAAPGPRP